MIKSFISIRRNIFSELLRHFYLGMRALSVIGIMWR